MELLSMTRTCSRYFGGVGLLILVCSLANAQASYRPESPAELLSDGLDSIAVQVESRFSSVPESTDLYPEITGELSAAVLANSERLWRAVWHELGYPVYTNPSSTAIRCSFTVEHYQIELQRERKGFLGGTVSYAGTFHLSGSVSIVDTAGRLREIIPVGVDRTFIVNRQMPGWESNHTMDRYPIEYSGALDRPEIRTILISIASGVVIYLFYTLRG